MKVLLVDDVSKLGWLGDVVDVNNGYARNYLLPYGLAQEATEANIKAIAEEKAKRSGQRLAEHKRMGQACEAVNGAEAVIAAKANEQGHLFGSVTEKQIALNLREQGFAVADEIVWLPEHIKQVGTQQVKLKYADGLEATVNVVVVAEGAENETPAEAENTDDNNLHGQDARATSQEEQSGPTDTLEQ